VIYSLLVDRIFDSALRFFFTLTFESSCLLVGFTSGSCRTAFPEGITLDGVMYFGFHLRPSITS